MIKNVRNVGTSARVLQQTSTRQASIVLWEREMRARKETFGVELYEVMDRYRSMGKENGGETAPKIAEIFQNCASDIATFKERRKEIQTNLVKSSQPKALCRNTSANSDTSEKTEQVDSATPTSWFQRRMSSSKLRSELVTLEKEMLERQKVFGVEVYDAMAYSVNSYVPADSVVQDLLENAKKDISIPLAKTQQAKKEINDVQTAGEILYSHGQIHEFVHSTPSCWAMLQVNIGIPEVECKHVAYRVCLELASGKSSLESRDATISQRQFQHFQKTYIDNPKGSQEFFHRCVFAAFDEDDNGVLDMEETDKFLDVFYVTGSIFQGDVRLPSKEELKELILKELDENGDGLFSFDEVRSLISGSANKSNTALGGS